MNLRSTLLFAGEWALLLLFLFLQLMWVLFLYALPSMASADGVVPQEHYFMMYLMLGSPGLPYGLLAYLLIQGGVRDRYSPGSLLGVILLTGLMPLMMMGVMILCSIPLVSVLGLLQIIPLIQTLVPVSFLLWNKYILKGRR